MTVGFMQPYFAPYLGYFDLIRQSDEWVVFDTAQYIRRGWVNRNRVLKANGDWAYITVPIQYAPLETPISQIKIDESQPWRQRILAQLDVIRNRAPHYEVIRSIIEGTLADNDHSLCHLNVLFLQKICAYLGIPFRPRLFSSMKLIDAKIESPGDWALQVCRKLGATEYLNPPGGRDLYDPAQFAASGISLRIQQFTPLVYTTPGFNAVENLSIIDVLAWNEPEVIMAHLINKQTGKTFK